MSTSLRLAVVLAALVPTLLPACASTPPEESVRPGVNESYLDPEMEVEEWLERFEVESREIFSEREAIADEVDLRRGMAVADVGAGTGVFLELFAQRVGPKGRVYAVDIAPRFVEHLEERVRAAGLEQVEVRLGHERSADLPENSVDVAFLCDVYHHLEYPGSVMRSIRRALRPGGELIVVDFDRIPGVSRQWVLDHVRASKGEVMAELSSFGFEVVGEVTIDGVEENYFLRLRER